jgi:hypothetical protein
MNAQMYSTAFHPPIYAKLPYNFESGYILAGKSIQIMRQYYEGKVMKKWVDEMT